MAGKTTLRALPRLTPPRIHLYKPIFDHSLVDFSACKGKTGNNKPFGAAAPLGVLWHLNPALFLQFDRLMALLKTKFLHPIVSDKTVQRIRLDDSLAPKPGQKATFIIAPAGFGKTTLVAHWASRSGHPTAWLSLDTTDNNPANFWRYIITALQQIQPSWGAEAQRLLADERYTDCLPAITSLLNELTESASQSQEPIVTLVLDDYHQIENSAVHQAVAYFIEHLSPALHLIVTSRTQPDLPLARWRVKGFIAELYTSDLMFSADEIVDFFRNYANQTLTPEEVEHISGATSGWIAALQLMILSQRQSAPASAKIDVGRLLSSGKKLIDDYVLAEILSQQPREVQEFLEDSASLLRINPDLCDYIRSSSNSREILTALEKANLFIVPLDNQHYWYRYHDLFRDALLSRVNAFAPDRAQRFQRAAVNWHLEQSHYHEAISQLIALEDWGWMATVLEDKGNELIRAGYHLYLMEWLSLIPSTLISHSPKLLMLRAWCYFYDNKFENIEAQLAQLELLLAQSSQRDSFSATDLAQLQNEISFMRAYLARPGQGESGKLTHQVLEKIRDTDIPIKSVSYFGLAQDHFRWGDLSTVVKSLESAIHYGQLEERYSTVLSSLGLLMWTQFIRGDLNHALSMNKAIQSWLDNFHHNQPQPSLVSCWRNAALCEIYREQDNLTAAQAYLNPLLHYYDRAEPGQRMMIHYVQAGIAFSQGNPALAIEHLDLALAIHEQKSEQILFEAPALQAAKLHYCLELGETQQAEALAKTISQRPSTNPLNLQREQLSLTRLQLEKQHFDQARNTLDQVLVTAREQGYIKLEIQALILLSLTLDAMKEREPARQVFSQALELAEKTQSIRLFSNESVQLINFFNETPLAGPSHHFQNAVLESLARKSKRLAKTNPIPAAIQTKPELAASELEETISKRELEVLQLIHEGLANKQIAAQLNLAPATVKAHIRNLYGKIGASSRTEALAKARKMGLLDQFA